MKRQKTWRWHRRHETHEIRVLPLSLVPLMMVVSPSMAADHHKCCAHKPTWRKTRGADECSGAFLVLFYFKACRSAPIVVKTKAVDVRLQLDSSVGTRLLLEVAVLICCMRLHVSSCCSWNPWSEPDFGHVESPPPFQRSLTHNYVDECPVVSVNWHHLLSISAVPPQAALMCYITPHFHPRWSCSSPWANGGLNHFKVLAVVLRQVTQLVSAVVFRRLLWQQRMWKWNWAVRELLAYLNIDNNVTHSRCGELPSVL